MRIVLDAVSKGRGAPALPPLTCAYASGSATLVRAETSQRPTVVGLLASGRMRPDAGEVTIDGRPGGRALRDRVALVDAPIVSEPAPDVSTLGVVAEELMFAGLPATRTHARRTLADLGLDRWARVPFGTVDPTARCRLLLELAAARPRVEGVVLVSPDRHGGDPAGWWNAALDLAARGLAVLVVAGDAAAAVLSGTSATDAPDAFTVAPEVAA